MIQQSANRRLELFVRSLCPEGCRPQQDALVARMSELESAGVIEGYDVHVWGKQVELDPETRTEPGERALATYRSFVEWADRNGRNLGSFFQERAVDSAVSGESYRSVVFPAFALAEYVDGDLAFVTPSADGQRIRTPTDRFDELDPRTDVSNAPQSFAGRSSTDESGPPAGSLTAVPGTHE